MCVSRVCVYVVRMCVCVCVYVCAFCVHVCVLGVGSYSEVDLDFRVSLHPAVGLYSALTGNLEPLQQYQVSRMKGVVCLSQHRGFPST